MSQGEALAEGFYWYAEKLIWGYEDTTKNPQEALRFYRQAADLGFSDAYIRIGELQEHGKGTGQNPSEALRSYQTAARAGNYLAYAFIARLLSRTEHLPRAEPFWRKFFQALRADPQPSFLAAGPGELIHAYIETQLRLGLIPGYLPLIRDYRDEVICHHQQRLEHAVSAEQLDRLAAVAEWIKANLKA